MSLIIPINDKSVISIRGIRFSGANVLDQNTPIGADIVEINYQIIEPFIQNKKVRWIVVEDNKKVFNGSYGASGFEEIINTVKRFARDLVTESWDKTELVINDARSVAEKEKEFLKEEGILDV